MRIEDLLDLKSEESKKNVWIGLSKFRIIKEIANDTNHSIQEVTDSILDLGIKKFEELKKSR